MFRNVFLKTLRDRRRSLIGWAIGLTGFAAYAAFLYPAIRESAADLTELTENLPEAVQALSGGEIDLATGAGYLQSQFFAFLVPLLLMVFAIGFGARTIAGEEQNGSLELVLATPKPRRQIVAEKLGALVFSVLFLAGVLWGALTAGNSIGGLGVPTSRLGGAALSAGLLALTFGTLALAVGCALGRRAVASAVAVVAGVVTYLLQAFSTFVEVLEPSRYASPWFYYDSGDVLRSGLEPGNVLVLAGLILVFSTVAILSFDRRDLRS